MLMLQWSKHKVLATREYGLDLLITDLLMRCRSSALHNITIIISSAVVKKTLRYCHSPVVGGIFMQKL